MPKSFIFCNGQAQSVLDENKLVALRKISNLQAFSQRRYQFMQDRTSCPGKKLLTSNQHPIQKSASSYFVSYNPERTNKKYLFFLTIDGKEVCYDIQDRGIKTSLQNSKICQINFRVNPSWYKGTLLCGNVMKDKFNKWMFLIEDLWISEGKIIADYHMSMKFQYLETLLNGYVSDPSVEVCRMEAVKLFLVRDLPRLDTEVCSLISYPFNGFVFYPCTVGTRYIFVVNEQKAPIKNESAFFLVSKVDDTDLADQFMIQCEHMNKLTFIGYVEVPSKEHRLELVKLLEEKESVILPCTYNHTLQEWTITNTVEGRKVSDVSVARRVINGK